MSNDKVILTCVASLLTLIAGYVGYAALTAKKYVSRSKIAKLVIYPIKSLPGVEVQHLEILPSLCKYKNFRDRSWILLDDANRMITLRNEPLLAKIRITLLENAIRLEAAGMKSIEVPVQQPLKKGDRIHTVDIWGQELDGQDCGQVINGWFSQYLGKKCKLIKHHDVFGFRGSKVIVGNELFKKRGKNMDILYQDGAPILLMNEKSVQDLNRRIREDHGDENPAEVRSDRFRPNIFFETDKPLEEDTWKFVKINDSEFQFLAECGRCKMTTFNKETGDYEAEPLRTLKKYRMGPYQIFQGAPKLGCYFKPIRAGMISVGDELFAAF